MKPSILTNPQIFSKGQQEIIRHIILTTHSKKLGKFCSQLW